MDETTKQALLARLEEFLGSASSEPTVSEPAGEAQDLYAIFVELAALRTEVRAKSRLVKTALDQFREVFETLRASHATLERELTASRSEAKGRERALLRPLLIDLLDLRDGLAAALQQPETVRLTWRERLSGRRSRTDGGWRAGLQITLRRFDQLLTDRRVSRVETLGRPLDPRSARVLATVESAGRPEGLVVEEMRGGYLWEEDVLRPAEVVVAKRSPTPEPEADACRASKWN